jgi:hypothetical protein
MTSINALKESVNRTKKLLKQHILFDEIQVIIKDDFVEPINLVYVLKVIEAKIPRSFFRDLDVIYIGDFPQLKAKNVESAYMNGAIFVSNYILDDDVLLKSIVHEVAHNLESVYAADVYGDSVISDEFQNKRASLRKTLEAYKLFCDPRLYFQSEYSKTFDDFLYKTVGYDRLSQITTKLFISPYAATSLREYFANGVEHYFLDENPKYLNIISPKLYKKINSLTTDLE